MWSESGMRRLNLSSRPTQSRRFPAPWTIEDIGAAFVVRDHNGQQLAYVYFEDGDNANTVSYCQCRSRVHRVRCINASLHISNHSRL
jgi:hypothetical protein